MAYNGNFVMICPLCQEAFIPVRLGQIYCCPEHGWEFRNQTNQLKNLEKKKRRRQRIHNLRVLVKLCMGGEHEPSPDRLRELEFDLKVLSRCMRCEEEKKLEMKQYKLWGFYVMLSNDGYWILPPRHLENGLQITDEEREWE